MAAALEATVNFGGVVIDKETEKAEGENAKDDCDVSPFCWMVLVLSLEKEKLVDLVLVLGRVIGKKRALIGGSFV